MTGTRVRRSFRELEREHFEQKDTGKQSDLEILVRAFRKLQDAPAEDFKSFFTIAGYHGQPFRGAGWGNGNSQWWGGYCHHGNILFPSWHRAYLLRLETALRDMDVEGARDIALPFFDEADEFTKVSGIPETFGLRNFPLSDGTTIKNPLFSYSFQTAVYDNISNDVADYTKHVGYETKRYPLSGLDTDDAKAHNAEWTDDGKCWTALNDNVKNWLSDSVFIGGEQRWTGVREKFHACLDAPFYTVFSNTTSAAQYNETLFDVKGWKPDAAKDPQASKAIVPLESPHNSLHLAIGGFDVPSEHDSPIAGANGDMGENNTASFDPIFYFHHCFIDYAFWKWQEKHDQMDRLVIEPQFVKYPGTNSTDNQGATPGVPGNSWLTLDSPLEPFMNPINQVDGIPLTSHDVTNIEKLGYTYGPGSLDPHPTAVPDSLAAVKQPAPVLRVTGANRAASPGSFLMTVWGDVNGDGTRDKLVGLESVLSRHNIEGCANCQTHLGVKAFINLHAMADIDDIDERIEVRVHTREDPTGKADSNVQWKKTHGRVGTIFNRD